MLSAFNPAVMRSFYEMGKLRPAIAFTIGKVPSCFTINSSNSLMEKHRFFSHEQTLIGNSLIPITKPDRRAAGCVHSTAIKR